MDSTPPRPLVLAHVMPWFESRSVSGKWGWHWTMGSRDPEQGQFASHYHPLIGPYDSGDARVVALQVELMRLSGIDGVLVDWYGDQDLHDYAVLHRNTEVLFRETKKAGLKFGLVYEDATVHELNKAGRFTRAEAVAKGANLFRRQAKWFKSPHYLKVNGKPVLLVFGPQFYSGPELDSMFDGRIYTLHIMRPGTHGAYDWPLPAFGASAERQRSASWIASNPQSIPVVYPRFHDFYAEAGVHASWGRIEDLDGKTFELTLARALNSQAPFIQIATWNDWGEGTMIEPSAEYGTRDLETIQRLTKSKFGKPDLARALARFLGR